MSKKFKSKKKRVFKWRIIIYFLLAFTAYQVTYNILFENKLANSNEEFLKYLLKDSNHHLLYEQNNKTIINKLSTLFSRVNLKKPITILENTFGYKSNNQQVYNDEYNVKDLKKMTGYIKDPNQTKVDDPVVYIYSTHQLENYSQENLENYNITPNVMMASYILKENLNKINIKTVVEESNITEFLQMNNWNYNESYKASRFYVMDAISKYPNLKLIIDLHRDAIKKSSSTATINNKKYARVLFVVGMEHQNYQANLDLANNMNELLNKKYSGLSRGVITKSGKGVDGIYNQDLNNKMILIECGGNENSIEEVMNTMNVLTEIIKEQLS